MDVALFDLLDFAPEAPTWAQECFYCRPDSTGHYDQAQHLAAHLPLTCSVCRQTEPNRLLFENSHSINLGGSWGRDALVCSALDLALNHLRYDARHGATPRTNWPLELGWRIGDDAAIPPAGWPDGSHATVCRAIPTSEQRS